MIFLALKLLGLFVLYYISSLVYSLVVRPYMARKKYSKYSNVTMVDKFYPVLGEAKLFEDNMKLNKPRLHHQYLDSASKGSSIDLRLTQFGPIQKIDICSVKAINEFEKLVPSKIDRGGDNGSAVTRLVAGTFSFLQSKKQWDLRRKYMSKILAINYCSKYIGMMLQTVDKHIDQLKVGDLVNFSQIVKNTSLMIMCKILFGEDIEDNMPTGLYIDPETFEQSHMRFDEMYPKVTADEFRYYTGFVANFFPTLAYNNLINPHKTSRKNIDECTRIIREFCQKSTDKDSVYNLLKSYNSSGKDMISEEEHIMDVMVMLFAGFDTSSYAIISLLYQLKMNPDKLEKLRRELDESKITQIDKSTKADQKEAYQN